MAPSEDSVDLSDTQQDAPGAPAETTSTSTDLTVFVEDLLQQMVRTRIAFSTTMYTIHFLSSH